MKNSKIGLGLALGLLVASTLVAGLYYKHFFIVFVFSLWLIAEGVMWRYSTGWRGLGKANRSRLRSMSSLIHLYGRFDTVSDRVVEEKIIEFGRLGTFSESELRWLARLKDLIALRRLVLSAPGPGKNGLRQGFRYRRTAVKSINSPENLSQISDQVSIQDITESATLVADLYWKLFDTALGGYEDLTVKARQLFLEIFEENFEASTARPIVEKLTDSMQRDRGVPFLVLNLIHSGNWKKARALTQRLLTEEVELDSDLTSTLYWLSELIWFNQEGPSPIEDFETTIRYLYHLCFTNPERAGFLEIDSQFFSQFEVINELAQEGFLFRENLIENVLALWKKYEGFFDLNFQGVLESITQRKSKIYDEYENWDRFWQRERGSFDRDYLYVVEGNLSYANGRYEDAKLCYEKALKQNPQLRSARLNLVFVYAQLGLKDEHDLAAQRIAADKDLLPAALFVAGDSYLLLGEEAHADEYYRELAQDERWEKKVDYYKSTFCYENKLYPLALKFAERAHRLRPADTAVSYHLSLCYNAVGQKDHALDSIRRMSEAPQWLNYYRFTLERDSGRHHEASHTLLQIPNDYFQDPEELEAAMEFAKRQQDLVLLRHLRQK